MKNYADIIVDISHSKLDKVFQYRVPDELTNEITVGTVVNIPFGKGNKNINGYVVGFTDKPNFDIDKIKDIISIDAINVSIEAHLIKLAVWMKERYACTIISALRTLIPISKKVNDKTQKEIVRNVNVRELESYIKIWDDKNFKALSRAGKYLINNERCRQNTIIRKANITTSVLTNLEKKGIITVNLEHIYREPYKVDEFKRTINKMPNEEQQKAIDVISDNLDNDSHVFLVHGITGSGKTEVYMQIIKKVIEKGQQAIVLIPEIALTPQTVRNFISRFGNKVGVMHSKLSTGEKYDGWRRARDGDISIMIGPRSAVFTPFRNLGIIIIDEEHEMSYKSEISPKYHAREVAIKRGEMTGATVVLGSATPSLETYYLARKGKYTLLELKHKAAATKKLNVEIVDMREELSNGNKSIFSDTLRNEIQNKLFKKEQIILFLNRRGYSRFVSCRQCGYVVKCKNCDIPYTYHAYDDKLICHYCGSAINMVDKCPSCNSKYIKQFGIGTEKVETYVKKEFPCSRVLRMDLDTTSKKNSYDSILGKFRNGDADILIGTQMVAKGHDFPNVTLVGVLAADLSLYMSDFRASERTFQLLTQVTGRAGRSILEGTAIIQSYTPDHYSITTSKDQDYKSFYEAEIKYRQVMNYPPFSNLLVLLIQSTNEKELIKRSFELKNDICLVSPRLGLEVIGPSPANISKIKNNYRRVILLRGNKYEELMQFINRYMIRLSNKYNDISIHIDINPLMSY
ncbi:primosomal protein N' [Vallitalea longa]|uniref:Replication restart protein PriA n=1 Tax=Vallitalea longa TaxID=2936439 RepID=A0A9W5YCY6_9FIRM|nr:primosomal protein N' [Vallitalea longa]GKX31687.1 primosomal protein N' [Vallitalea longa]